MDILPARWYEMPHKQKSHGHEKYEHGCQKSPHWPKGDVEQHNGTQPEYRTYGYNVRTVYIPHFVILNILEQREVYYQIADETEVTG
jgi:hypothetical protein